MLSVLTVSYASSVRAYLQQQREIRSLHGQIAKAGEEIDGLAKEEARWKDPAFKEQMARDQFGFVKQGEIGFIVLDSDGNPVDPNGTLDPPKTTEKKPPQWYGALWASVEAADSPPQPSAPAPTPAEQIPAP